MKKRWKKNYNLEKKKKNDNSIKFEMEIETLLKTKDFVAFDFCREICSF